MNKVQSEITAEDYQAFLKFVNAIVSRQVKHSRSYNVASYFLVLLAIVGMGTIWALNYRTPGAAKLMIPSFIVGMAFMIALMVAARKAQIKAMRPRDDGSMLGPREYAIEEAGIKTWTADSEAYRWRIVGPVEETATHVFIMVDRIAGLILPKRCFGSAAECEAFVAKVRAAAPQTGDKLELPAWEWTRKRANK